MIKPQHRELGTITSVTEDDERGYVTWFAMNFGGTGQGFGGYVVGPYKEDWVRELCALFDVGDLQRIVGKKAYALRSFTGLSSTILGIESAETNKRFIVAEFFRRRGIVSEEGNELAHARTSAKNTIEALTRRINQEVYDLMRLESDYCEWDPLYIERTHEGG